MHPMDIEKIEKEVEDDAANPLAFRIPSLSSRIEEGNIDDLEGLGYGGNATAEHLNTGLEPRELDEVLDLLTSLLVVLLFGDVEHKKTSDLLCGQRLKCGRQAPPLLCTKERVQLLVEPVSDIARAGSAVRTRHGD